HFTDDGTNRLIHFRLVGQLPVLVDHVNFATEAPTIVHVHGGGAEDAETRPNPARVLGHHQCAISRRGSKRFCVGGLGRFRGGVECPTEEIKSHTVRSIYSLKLRSSLTTPFVPCGGRQHTPTWDHIDPCLGYWWSRLHIL